MVNGDLKIYALEALRGDIAYSTTVVPLHLGGLSNPNMGSVSLSLPVPPESKVVKVLLEIGMVTRAYPERMRWRLWFDGVAVSREYRPKSIAKLSDEPGYYSKAVFDITPIYRHERSVHEVTVAYEGSDPVTVEHVGLLAIYDVPDSVVSYAFVSGALAIDPGERYTLSLRLRDVPTDATSASMRVVAALTHRDSKLAISVNGSRVRELSGFVGVEDANLDDIPVASEYRVSFEHESGSRHARLSTIVVTVAKRTLPDIVVDSVERVNGKARVRLVNRGTSTPEKLMLLVMVPGESIQRMELEPLAPGEARVVEVEAPKGKMTAVRIVWVKHGRPYQREVKL